MKLSSLRRILLRLFLVFLCLSAGLAIIAVLGVGFGELQMKIILSTLAVAAANICGMCCAAYMQNRGHSPAAIAGIASAVVAAAMAVAGIWGGMESKTYWRWAMTMIILSLTFAPALGVLIPRLRKEHHWIQIAGVGCLIILAVLILGLVWADVRGDGYFRIMVVVAIISVLCTLVVPILSKFKSAPADATPSGTVGTAYRLVLEFVSPGLYRDLSGGFFHVQPADPPPRD
jgi:hypothetical protein